MVAQIAMRCITLQPTAMKLIVQGTDVVTSTFHQSFSSAEADSDNHCDRIFTLECTAVVALDRFMESQYVPLDLDHRGFLFRC